MTRKYVEVVHREGFQEAVAVVTCDSTPLIQENGLLPFIKEAVTNWVKNTVEGWTAWNQNAEDLNVGDLVSYLGDSKLKSYLAGCGVYNLDIEVEPHASSSWKFDTVLADIEKRDDDEVMIDVDGELRPVYIVSGKPSYDKYLFVSLDMVPNQRVEAIGHITLDGENGVEPTTILLFKNGTYHGFVQPGEN